MINRQRVLHTNAARAIRRVTAHRRTNATVGRRVVKERILQGVVAKGGICFRPVTRLPIRRPKRFRPPSVFVLQRINADLNCRRANIQPRVPRRLHAHRRLASVSLMANRGRKGKDRTHLRQALNFGLKGRLKINGSGQEQCSRYFRHYDRSFKHAAGDHTALIRRVTRHLRLQRCRPSFEDLHVL